MSSVSEGCSCSHAFPMSVPTPLHWAVGQCQLCTTWRKSNSAAYPLQPPFPLSNQELSPVPCPNLGIMVVAAAFVLHPPPQGFSQHLPLPGCNLLGTADHLECSQWQQPALAGEPGASSCLPSNVPILGKGGPQNPLSSSIWYHLIQ